MKRSRELFQKGLCWRVGNGQFISAKEDPWVPGLLNYRSRFNSVSDGKVTVAEFILGNGDWNEIKVKDCFPPYDSQAILNIPLQRELGVDIRFWPNNMNGKYSVKSGYKLELDHLKSHPFHSRHPYFEWWKRLWNLHVPPKVRIFLWRATREFIPSAGNLAVHHVPIEGTCFLCKFHFASTTHCLIFCPSLRSFWKTTIFWSVLKRFRGDKFVDCAMMVADQIGKEELEVFTVLLWALWTEVCKYSHSSMDRPLILNVDWAVSWLNVFRLSSSNCLVKKVDNLLSVENVWKVPQSGWLRLDVDAGYDVVGNRYSCGAVIRDSMGCIVRATASIISGIDSVRGAELVAIQKGLDLCKGMRLSNVCIFSDSILAVRAALNYGEDISISGLIAKEINNALTSVKGFTLSHMRRSANGVAHTLARRAFASDDCIDFTSNCIPLWISDIVSLDLQHE